MTNEKMTIHRGLSEIKVLTKRIDKIAHSIKFVTVNRHSNTKINGVTVSENSNNMISDLQQIKDLMKRKNAINRAIKNSNATTKVTIDGVEYSVVDAINMKQCEIQELTFLLNNMRQQWNEAQKHLELENSTRLEQKLNAYMASLQNADIKDEELEKQRKSFIEANSFDLVDPNNLLEEMKILADKIDNFTTNVDAVLSESNAITMIDVNY